jgi:TolB-like protein
LSFFNELKRRNVFKVGVAYLITAWLLVQVADMLLDNMDAPPWVLQAIFVVLLVGLFVTLLVAWAFELTPEGIKKEKDVDRTQSITPQTGRKLNTTIITILVLALGYFAWDKFMVRPTQDVEVVVAEPEQESTTDIVAEAALPTDKSIAVLPFDNRSNQADDEFFTSGIHDDLLTQLAQISSLRVISRTSVAQFKDTSKTIREIAELLGVATILEGGVQRAGNQVRINMQLIDAATDAHLWAQTYDRELTANNIFSIQSEVATAVTEAMRATLSPEEQQRISTVPTENMQALEEYFKGRAELDQRTRPALESSRLRFEQARQLDPDFALAYAGEAQAIMLLADSGSAYGEIPVTETLRLARPLLERALELAPSDAQVLGVYGLLESNSYNSELALGYFARSVELNPSSGEVLNWQRMAQMGAGRFKDATETNMRMVEVDPMSMIALFNGVLGIVRQEGHDVLTAEMMLERLESLDKSFGFGARARVEEIRGNITAAAAYYYQSMELNPGRSNNRGGLANLLARNGLVDEALLIAPDNADDIAQWSGDWDRAVQLANEGLELEPDSVDALFDLFMIMMFTGDAEGAYPLATRIWERFEENQSEMYFVPLFMSWVATKTEHTEQARLYRNAGAKWLQVYIEAGIVDLGGYWGEAQLAAIDGRDSDTIIAITKYIDKGGRWQAYLDHPVFDHLKNNLGFQAQVNRLADLNNTERGEILAMLCGPDTILTSWKPAPETCELYSQEAVIAEG